MKEKLFKLLKAKLREHIFSVIMVPVTAMILYYLLSRKGDIYPPLLFLTALLCLMALFQNLKDFSKSFRDYSVYVKNHACEEITGTVISFHKERSGKNSHEYPVVRDEITGAELIMKISNAKDVIKNRKYKFLYLENTKLAVIAETVWEDPNEGNDEYWTPPEADAWEDSDDEYWTPPKNDRESI
jgi:hypothetical protein